MAYSKLAITGFVLSLISFLVIISTIISNISSDLYPLTLVLSIVGFILSIISLVRINKNGLSGKVYAILGIVLSSIDFLLWFVAFLIILSRAPHGFIGF